MQVERGLGPDRAAPQLGQLGAVDARGAAADVVVAALEGQRPGRRQRRGRDHRGLHRDHRHAIALSGLLEAPDGRTLAFALVTNGHGARQKLGVRAGHEQVVAELDRYLAALAPPAAPVEVAPAATEDGPAVATSTSEIDRTGDDLADDVEPTPAAP